MPPCPRSLGRWSLKDQHKPMAASKINSQKPAKGTTALPKPSVAPLKPLGRQTQPNSAPSHKIHVQINTAPSAPAQPSLPTPASTLPRPNQDQGSLLGSTPKKAKVRLQSSPPPEPKAPPDVKVARKRQTEVLKMRQDRETRGQIQGAVRDSDVGAGYWPNSQPLL